MEEIVLKNGVYEQVGNALKEYKKLEFSSIELNPHYEICMHAIEVITKKHRLCIKLLEAICHRCY
jgi:NADP-dependent alcohol dehydrogenase